MSPQPRTRGRTLDRWHRRLGLIAAPFVLAWAVSGLLHPLLSQYQPQPAARTPPVQALPVNELPSPATLLADNGIASFERLRLVQQAGLTAWRIETEGQVVYLDARTGTPLESGERQHAEALARHYLGAPATAITALRTVDAFAGDYVYINRILPAWAVDFDRDDGMTVYVDTASERLVTLTDERKRLYTAIFRVLHNWAPLEGNEQLRVVLAGFVLLLALATAVLGMVKLTRPAGRRASPIRRWHRRGGMVLVGFQLLFVASGVFHLTWQAQERLQPPPSWREAMSTAAAGWPTFPDRPLGEMALLPLGAGRAAWRLRDLDGGLYWRDGGGNSRETTAGDIPTDDASYAERVAAALGLAPARPGTALEINRFGGEYGFVFKLLPVWQVTVAGGGEAGPVHAYVDAADARVSTLITGTDRIEGLSFAHLHKWEWLKHLIGQWPRDVASMATGTAIALITLLGVALALRRKAALPRA